jgi:hypothetical protein
VRRSYKAVDDVIASQRAAVDDRRGTMRAEQVAKAANCRASENAIHQRFLGGRFNAKY